MPPIERLHAAFAVNWRPDNNVASQQIMMTHNATISIAAKWLDDSNNDKLTPEQRAEARKELGAYRTSASR